MLEVSVEAVKPVVVAGESNQYKVTVANKPFEIDASDPRFAEPAAEAKLRT